MPWCRKDLNDPPTAVGGISAVFAITGSKIYIIEIAE